MCFAELRLNNRQLKAKLNCLYVQSLGKIWEDGAWYVTEWAPPPPEKAIKMIALALKSKPWALKMFLDVLAVFFKKQKVLQQLAS